MTRRKSRDSGVKLTQIAWKEIDSILEETQNLLIVEAARLAYKNNHEFVDGEYVRKVSRRLAIQQNSAMTWVLRLMLALPSALAIMQLGTLISLSIWQPPLWILPIFVFVWALVITFIFKDFI
jgi:hypothetical protein